jgi:hypothetical protein
MYSRSQAGILKNETGQAGHTSSTNAILRVPHIMNWVTWLACEETPESLFTENETNKART